MKIPLIGVFALMALMVVAVVVGSSLPLFFTMHRELNIEVDQMHLSYNNLMASSVQLFLEPIVGNVQAVSSTLTRIPPYERAIETIYHMLVASSLNINFIAFGMPTGGYYALTYNPAYPLATRWEMSIQDPPAGIPCRMDFTPNVTILPDIQNLTHIAKRCAFDAQNRDWYNDLQSNIARFGLTHTRIGREVPQAYVTIGAGIYNLSNDFQGVLYANIETTTFTRILPNVGDNDRRVAFVMELATANILGSSDRTFQLFDESVYDPNAVNPIVSFARMVNVTQHRLMRPFAGRVARLDDTALLAEPLVLSSGHTVLVCSDITVAGSSFRIITVQHNDIADHFTEYAATVGLSCIVLALALAGAKLATGHKLRSATKAIVELAGKLEQVTAFADTSAANEEDAAALDTVFAEIAQIQDRFLQMKTTLAISAKYIPKEVITDFLLQGSVGLGMVATNVTMLFIDIEKFTTICEQLPADDLQVLLEHYFDVQSRAILRNGGTIDKFVGDAIAAVWGAPSVVGDHNVRALATALRLKDQIALDEHASVFASVNAHVHVRVGVHHGAVMAGNIGCDKRVAYTVVGHNALVVGALEGLCKQFGVRICTSDATLADVPENTFLLRPLGRVRVHGKPLVLHEVLGVHPHHNIHHYSNERLDAQSGGGGGCDEDNGSSRHDGATAKGGDGAAASQHANSSSHVAAKQRRLASVASTRQVISETLRYSVLCTEQQVRQCAKYREAAQLFQRADFPNCRKVAQEFLTMVPDSDAVDEKALPGKAARLLISLCDQFMISPPALDEWTGELPATFD